MHAELSELQRRVEASIVRIPDRLSTPAGEAVRADWAGVFAQTIGGTIDQQYISLPFHLLALTDPVLVRLRSGWVVLDHPSTAGAFEWVLTLDSVRSYVETVPTWWSLYEHRHPRLIVVPDRRSKLSLSRVINRLADFHGPFEGPASWLRDRRGGLHRATHPVDSAWLRNPPSARA